MSNSGMTECFCELTAEHLPGVPSSPERKAYGPALIQQHLSLWDVLQFSDKVSCRWQAPIWYESS